MKNTDPWRESGVPRDEGTAKRPSVQGAKALAKALDTLLTVAESSAPQRFGDIQETTGLPKTTLFRFLRTFCDYGVLTVDADERTYSIGPRLQHLAENPSGKQTVLSRATAELDRLADELGETTRLVVPENTHLKVLFERNSAEGSIYPALASEPVPDIDSSATAAILSKLPNAQQQNMIDKIKEQHEGEGETGTQVAKRLHAALGFAISTGFAVHRPESAPGVVELSAALLDTDDHPVGAISILSDEKQLTPAKRLAYGQRLVRAARAASLGGQNLARHRRIPPRPQLGTQCTARAVDGTEDHVGVSPLWCPKRGVLYWLDVLGAKLSIYHPGSGRVEERGLRELTGAIGLTTGRHLIAGAQDGFQFLDPDTGRTSALTNPEIDVPGSRLSHGKVDANGRFWCASILPVPRAGPGRLYSIGANCSSRLELSRINAAKGMAWSPNGNRFYLTDSSCEAINLFDVDPETGRVINGRRFISHEGLGTPNGITVDRDGQLWVAIYGGWAIHCYGPDGSLRKTIPLPVPLPTSLTFGGPKMRTLFVTTSRVHVQPADLIEAPKSGALFQIEVDAVGSAPNRFKLPQQTKEQPKRAISMA